VHDIQGKSTKFIHLCKYIHKNNYNNLLDLNFLDVPKLPEEDSVPRKRLKMNDESGPSMSVPTSTSSSSAGSQVKFFLQWFLFIHLTTTRNRVLFFPIG